MLMLWRKALSGSYWLLRSCSFWWQCMASSTLGIIAYWDVCLLDLSTQSFMAAKTLWLWAAPTKQTKYLEYESMHWIQTMEHEHLTLSLPSSKSTFSQPLKEKMYSISDVVRVGSRIIFHLSKRWKAKFFILCDVLFLVRLQEKWLEPMHLYQVLFTSATFWLHEKVCTVTNQGPLHCDQNGLILALVREIKPHIMKPPHVCNILY